MCPAHRTETLKKVRQRLGQGRRCLLISTQCVEAGVDLDFPVVYRAFAPLEAIAQAAGRCNRNDRDEAGSVIVFHPEEEAYPDRVYRQATAVTNILLEQHCGGLDLDDPTTHRRYYQTLFDLGRPENHGKELQQAIEAQHFPRAAQEYRIIDRNAINVLVAYDIPVFDELCEEVRRTGLTRTWIAKARPHAIGLFHPRDDDPVRRWLSSVPVGRGKTAFDWFIYLRNEHYDPQRGLVPPVETECLIA
jgi:hypothetical protein